MIVSVATISSIKMGIAISNKRLYTAWVHTLDEDDEDLIAAVQSRPLIPPEIQFAQHNSTPSPKFTFRSGRPDGRRFDAQRGATPPLPTGQVIETGSRWKAFAEASAYPAISAEGRELVTEEWWARNGPDYSRPWLAGVDNNGDLENGSTGVHMFKAKRRVWHVRAQRTILRSPIVPMIIRIIVWFFSSVALGLASSIHHITDKTDNEATQTASTNMAIIVDAVAMVYLMYITYDEYSGKPLGLRPARAKMRLIFLDLFFIVFDSANLSLAFENIGSGFCTTHFVTSTGQPKIPSPDRHAICARQKGLASVLLIALIAWLLTFSISVLR